MPEASVLSWPMLNSGRDGEELTKILKRRYQGGGRKTRRASLLEAKMCFREEAYCIFHSSGHSVWFTHMTQVGLIGAHSGLFVEL